MVSTIHDPSQLTSKQQDIIVAAMEDRGCFQVTIRADTKGKAVRTKKKKFFDAEDKNVASEYVLAVQELVRLLFVQESGKRDQFELTNFGWLIGRKLRQERQHS